MRVPLYSCAPGKAILAHWGEARLAEWFHGRGKHLKRFTATTVTRREDLVRELEEIRISGYAPDRAEGVEGIHCVAVPVFDEYRQPIAAITVMAPLTRLPEEDFARLAEMCRKAAEQIERKLRE